MKVKYRFLECKDDEGYIHAAGIAYIGFFNEGTNFLTLRSMKARLLKADLDKLTIKDLGEPNRELPYYWGEIKEIKISEEDEEWTPDELLENQQKNLESLIKKQQQRKTA